MKTAILISGWPRFHTEFDEQLENLQGSEFEWIVTLWKNYPQTVDITHNAGLTPSFINTVKTEEDARTWFEARMPKGHVLRHVSFIDWNDFPKDLMQGDYSNMVPGTVPEAIFRQFWMFQQVNNIRHSYGPYDLVMRTRGDAIIFNPLQFDKIHNILQNEKQRLVIASNNRQRNWCDTFAIGTPEAMDIYGSVVDSFNDMYQRGVTMHPENIVCHVLESKGIYWMDDGILANIRHSGKYLTPTFTGTQKYYEPDFGRW
jgi:hypothetical protein